MSAKKSPEKGVMLVCDRKTGREYRCAVGAVQRIEWLADLQARGATPAIINLALAVTQFINGETGHTFAGDAKIGTLAGIKERAARLYITALIQQGRLVRIRCRRAASEMYLVMPDRQTTCQSKDEQDRQTTCQSESVLTGKDTTLDRQRYDTLTGKEHFGNQPKSITCERITQLDNSVIIELSDISPNGESETRRRRIFFQIQTRNKHAANHPNAARKLLPPGLMNFGRRIRSITRGETPSGPTRRP